MKKEYVEPEKIELKGRSICIHDNIDHPTNFGVIIYDEEFNKLLEAEVEEVTSDISRPNEKLRISTENAEVVYIVNKKVEYEEGCILTIKSTEEWAIRAAKNQLKKENSKNPMYEFIYSQINDEGLNLIHEWQCSNNLFSITIEKWIVTTDDQPDV